MTTNTPYQMYVADVSYFSGKLEAYMRLRGIPYARSHIHIDTMWRVLLPATGWMKIPALQAPDGRWLRDTTAMQLWLEDQHTERPLLPRDAYRRFMCLLIEDWCDEWLWRPAMYWRWGFPDNALALGQRIGRDTIPNQALAASAFGTWFRYRQQRHYLWGDGVNARNREAVAGLYPKLLSALQPLLSQRQFVLGATPSWLDVALMGPLKRHYSEDPTPAAWMQQHAPDVFTYVQRVWDASAANSAAEAQWDDFSDTAWDAILEDIGSAYLPYLLDNARAYQAGEKQFSGRYGGIDYTDLPVVSYRVWCLEALQAAYAALDTHTREALAARLSPFKVIAPLKAPPILSGLKARFSTPFEPPQARPLLRHLGLMFTGHTWKLPGER